ncbi:hypothetical protein MTR62_07990 [Novosphingobium sp. 1949]|uniref:Uncharacterized protein n=1 Tax=Novosphingobium organovorum TaxID=2930092 RepID=A0ABT0BC45_9SPHN|nr:hypothetical protein [Novosphingobium organovorum]MCJ2182631.1 hypothetical protein [Novosphingobium organovorum]
MQAGLRQSQALGALAIAGAALLLAPPAQARQSERPITDSDPSAMDVAKTPVTDLNLAKDDIPEVLIRATQKPYDLTGLATCRRIGAAVSELDAILGPDLDIPQKERDRISAGRVAKWVISSFIPFRGLIREISGANDHQRKVRAAIQAGMARRGFLKGVGAMRHCSYPAAPATDADVARIRAELDRVEAAEKTKGKDDSKAAADDRARNEASPDASGETGETHTANGVPIVNQPVVQRIP